LRVRKNALELCSSVDGVVKMKHRYTWFLIYALLSIIGGALLASDKFFRLGVVVTGVGILALFVDGLITILRILSQEDE
jgi:uncharacterized membrane protein HdeD (DUF308 family)